VKCGSILISKKENERKIYKNVYHISNKTVKITKKQSFFFTNNCKSRNISGSQPEGIINEKNLTNEAKLNKIPKENEETKTQTTKKLVI